MARFARFRAGSSGLARVVRGAAMAVALAAVGLPVGLAPAGAQGFGWLGNLFGGGQRPYAQPRYPGGYGQPDDRYDPPRRRAPRRQAADPTRTPRDRDGAGRDAKVPPKSASVFVYVFGDSFGQSLAGGLDDALADRQDVAVVHKAKAATGLVAGNVSDWPKVIDDVLAERDKAAKVEPGNAGSKEAASADRSKVDVAVMMVGSNDRQPLRENGKVLAVGTPEWTAAYRTRVMAIDEAFHRRDIPLVWVGVPITRDDDFADDMAAFNDIYRDAAAKTGAVYVDTWEAFSDDDGDFSPNGPDINGQIVRLRTADGIYFTKAGARKLAHFVEVHVRRALDGKAARPVLPEVQGPGARPVPRKPDVGPISSLTEPPSARDGRLASSYRPEVAREPQGEPEKEHPPSGRADDLRWPAGTTPNP